MAKIYGSVFFSWYANPFSRTILFQPQNSCTSQSVLGTWFMGEKDEALILSDFLIWFQLVVGQSTVWDSSPAEPV